MYCKDCGAVVTLTDRFCPACGTPNSSCRLHPKFAPELRVFEPAVVTEVAREGAPACPRCHRAIARIDEWCPGCGMDLQGVWRRHETARRLAQHLAERGAPAPYRSLDRGSAVVGGMAGVLVLLCTVGGLA